MPALSVQIPQVAELLLEKSADKEHRSHLGTPLVIASRYGKAGIVKLLLAKKAHTDPKDFDGFQDTALKKAAENGHTGIFTSLLEARAGCPDEDRRKTEGNSFFVAPINVLNSVVFNDAFGAEKILDAICHKADARDVPQSKSNNLQHTRARRKRIEHAIMQPERYK